MSTACASDNGPRKPYADRIETAQQQATSAFEREVLKDGQISRDEYEEAFQQYQACASQQGLTIDLIDHNGYYTFSFDTSDRNAQIEASCERGTILLIAGIYQDMLVNPQEKDLNEVVYDCLVTVRLIPDGYTLEDYKSDIQDEIDRMKALPSGQVPSISSGTFPFDRTDIRYDACLANPANPVSASISSSPTT